MSLLAYLVPRIAASGAEPAATQALAYLLRSPDIARAFIDAVGRTGNARFPLGRIEAEEHHGKCIPDLTIRDADDVVRIFVENKFWAGLMDGQPVAYLDEMPDEESSLVVFIVPHERMYGLWDELKERCRQSGVEIGSESKGDAIYWASAGGRTLAITSWKQVLGILEQAADAKRHADLRADIVQLRGLTDQMDADKFLPLREEELTDVNVPLRMINYTGLIDDIVGRLETDGVADTKGCGKGCGYTFAGCSLRLHERFKLWLGVDQKVWRDRGITPMWIEAMPSAIGVGIVQIEQLFGDLPERDGWICIPIRLAAGVERDRVINDAARQVRNIGDRLLEASSSG